LAAVVGNSIPITNEQTTVKANRLQGEATGCLLSMTMTRDVAPGDDRLTPAVRMRSIIHHSGDGVRRQLLPDQKAKIRQMMTPTDKTSLGRRGIACEHYPWEERIPRGCLLFG
jgi:hypothetical protein